MVTFWPGDAKLWSASLGLSVAVVFMARWTKKLKEAGRGEVGKEDKEKYRTKEWEGG